MTVPFFSGKHYLTETIAYQTPYDVILGGLPGYIFFSTYVILAIFWYILYNRAHDESTAIIRRIRVFYIIMNLFVYSIWITLLILMFLYQGNDLLKMYFHSAEAIFAACIGIFASLATSFLGGRVYFKLASLPCISSVRLEIARKIGILTGVLTALFFLRSVMILLDFFVFHDAMDNLISKLIFQIIFELFGSVVILYVLNRKIPERYDETFQRDPTQDSLLINKK